MEIEIAEWLLRILRTDEYHISLNDEVNTQNFRIGSTDNPHEIVHEDLHDKKVTLWCGFTANFILLCGDTEWRGIICYCYLLTIAADVTRLCHSTDKKLAQRY